LNGQGEKVPHDDFPILPTTKVGALLERYPELEDVLITLAPPFQKLKNPLLRNGVAKVATLKHAAVVGGMPVNDLVNKLRAAVGQQAIASEDVGGPVAYFSDQPEWYATAKIVSSIDERAADPNKMPIVTVLQKVAQLQAGRDAGTSYNFRSRSGNRDHKEEGPASMVRATRAGIDPNLRFQSLLPNAFHEKAGWCQGGFCFSLFLFEVFAFLTEPTLSPSFHSHSFVSDWLRGARWVFSFQCQAHVEGAR
jgi:hypothetical protein